MVFFKYFRKNHVGKEISNGDFYISKGRSNASVGVCEVRLGFCVGFMSATGCLCLSTEIRGFVSSKTLLIDIRTGCLRA